MFSTHMGNPGVSFATTDEFSARFTKIIFFFDLFLNVKSFLESNSLDILALCETNDSNLKGFCYSDAWSCSLCKGRTSFYMELICRKVCRYLLTFSTGFTSFSVLFLFPLLITFFVFIHIFLCFFI